MVSGVDPSRTDPGSQPQMIPAASLAGIYPNEAGQGIGRGHVFALLELAARAFDVQE